MLRGGYKNSQASRGGGGGGDIPRLMWRVRRSNGPFVEEWNGKIPMPCVGGSRF